MAWLLIVPRQKVWPSGVARAQASEPMLPPAPARFSTTIGWPTDLLISVLTSRAMVSETPAEKGTISRIGWFGQDDADCAWAMVGSAARESRAAAARRRVARDIPGFLLPPSGGLSALRSHISDVTGLPRYWLRPARPVT